MLTEQERFWESWKKEFKDVEEVEKDSEEIRDATAQWAHSSVCLSWFFGDNSGTVLIK